MWQKVKNIYHLFVAIGANVYYRFPGRKLTVIAVTGTDGKTTTVNLIYHLLKTAGKDVSMISTVGANIHGHASPLGYHVTNPASIPLQRFLKLSLSNKNMQKKENYLVLEVTSHGIDQNRIWGIPITLGLITNITHEHLDYHKTYENYVKTKVKLLKHAKIAVYNSDDISSSLVKQQLSKSAKKTVITFGLSQESNINPENVSAKINWNSYNVFTQYNILAAISACSLVTDINNNNIERAIKSFIHPTGRQEIVYKKDFAVMIDFAHTPHSFEEILSSINKNTHKRIIHVFGSASERDDKKRPIMGKISSQYADVIVLTSEDPRKEDIYKIMSEIEAGIDKEEKKRIEIYKIPDRQEAITKAILIAEKGDFVLLTGKAHEKSMNYGRGEEPWNEFEAVKKALKIRSTFGKLRRLRVSENQTI